MEISNNVKKNLIGGVACFITAVILTSLIWGGIYFTAIKHSNTKLEATTNRLTSTEQRLAESNNTIEQCKQSLNDISTRLSTSTDRLEEIIGNLEYISKKIQDMENCLNSSNNNNSIINYSTNMEVKQCQDIN